MVIDEDPASLSEFQEEVNNLLGFAEVLVNSICDHINLRPQRLTDLADSLDFLRTPDHMRQAWEDEPPFLHEAGQLLMEYSALGIDTLYDLANAVGLFECARQELRDLDAMERDQSLGLYWLADGIAACATVQSGLISLAGREELSRLSRKGSDKAHAENRSAKASAIKYFNEHRSSFSSLDDAAEKIAGKIVPYRFRTVRNWLTGLSVVKAPNLSE